MTVDISAHCALPTTVLVLPLCGATPEVCFVVGGGGGVHRGNLPLQVEDPPCLGSFGTGPRLSGDRDLYPGGGGGRGQKKSLSPSMDLQFRAPLINSGFF